MLYSYATVGVKGLIATAGKPSLGKTTREILGLGKVIKQINE